MIYLPIHRLRPLRLVAILLLLGTVLDTLSAQQLVRVPADQPNLQTAISAVNDDGVIEMAAGTYQAPDGGYTIYDLPSPKGFTVRAAAGASVTFTGGGTTDILRFAPSSQSKVRPITFERLTFANGRSTTGFIGGGMTLVNAQAIFKACTFQNNAANSPGPGTGGGAQWIAGSLVSFDACIWSDNTSPNFGAGMSAIGSSVYIRNSRFVNNRTNVPGHSANSSGGAVFVNDATLRVSNCTFDNNQAGYVGGAIYAIGLWKDPVSTPAADVIVRDSVFNGNVAKFDPSFTGPHAPAVGGAVHFEGQTTAKIYNCRFNNNTAAQGGALSNYLAITELTGCVFKGNTAAGSASDEGFGGAIIALSSENGGANHRPAELDVTDTLIQGSGSGLASAKQGGCIFAGGDLTFAYGSPPDGTPASNRAIIKLTRVVMADAAVSGDSSLPGIGGAFLGAFVDLRMDNSMIINCRSSASGAGIQLIQNSVANLTNSIVSRCISAAQGTAFTVFGSALNMNGCSVINNVVNGSDRGVAITSAPTPPANGLPAFDVTGLVQNSVFSNNLGATIIYDGDSGSAPFNRLQFSNNRFFPGSNSIYFDDVIPAYIGVPDLNTLVLKRSDGTETVKSPVPNTVPSSAPVTGNLLMLPPTILQSGGPGETLPLPAYLGFAANGGQVFLDGSAQGSDAAVVPTSTDGKHTLTVGTTNFVTIPPPAVALNIATRLPVGTSQIVLIGGFIIQGQSPKRVAIRAIGPSLNGIVAGALQDPRLELHDSGGGLIGQNDNWRSTQIGGVVTTQQTIELEATGVAPSNNAESAIVATLNPGAYTAIVAGTNNATGIANVEIYDLDAVYSSTLANISTRGFVQTGDNIMIGGFIYLGGAGQTNVIVRAIGPSLSALGITNPLADPMLELHDSNGATIAVNDDWKNSPDAATIQRLGFQLSNDAEAAIYQNALPRGPYTAVVRGKAGGVGVAVVEAYIF